MKTNKTIVCGFLAVIFALAFTSLSLTSCRDHETFLVTFETGEGGGTPPKSIRTEDSFTFPGQGNMTAPEGKRFLGWLNKTYQFRESYINEGRFDLAGRTGNTYGEDQTYIAIWGSGKYGKGGVYIGLISFAGDAKVLYSYHELWGQGFVYLNNEGRDSLKYIILRDDYKQAETSGTALFYGVHKALAHLTANAGEFSSDISSVNMITFTDGLDNASFGASNSDPIEGKSGVMRDDYATYLRNEIGSRKINGKPITAYSVGIKGSDVEDEVQFAANLRNIASTTENVKQPADFSELDSVFSEIARGLSFTPNFYMTTTQNDPGTIIRMTFDVTGTTSADAAASSKYIEGTLAYSGGVWTLTNITYRGGITSDTASGSSITGTVSGSNIGFLFKNISGHTPATIQQWTKSSAGSTTWQRNSEYSASGSVSASTAIIQLVLDASTSLDYGQVGQIRSAVSSFIETLSARIQN